MADLLVVDDDDVSGRVLTLLLRECGHNAVCRANGQAAIEHVRSAHCDLVLLDLMMPGVDGLEVLKSLRADEQTRNVAVVMYTAISDPERQAEAIRLGAQDYLIKGQRWSDIYPRIKAVLPS